MLIPLLIVNLLERSCLEADPRFLNLMGSTFNVLRNCVDFYGGGGANSYDKHIKNYMRMSHLR